MKTLEIIWIAMGAVLTTATQLRLSSFPIGIGEVMLLVWMLFVISKILIRGYHLVTPIFKINLLFWLIAIFSLTLGLFIAEAMDVKAEEFQHDYMAFFFAFIFSFCCSTSETFYRKIEKIVAYVISWSPCLLFFIFAIPSTVPFLKPWMDGVRYTGWSKNPNQLALLLSMIPFFSLHFVAYKNQYFFKKIWYIILISICCILGLATGSDALILCWIAGLTIVLFFFFLEKITNTFVNQKHFTNSLKKIYQVIIGLIIIALAIILIHIGYQQIYSSSVNVYEKSNQGSERVILWEHGISAISYSPLFGLGPGAHSGETGPFLNFEAHNTFIDWGTSTGIIGLTAYMTLLTWTAWNAWRKKCLILASAVTSLAVFSTFHYVLRNPIFWFYIIAIMTLSQQLSTTKYLNRNIKKNKNSR